MQMHVWHVKLLHKPSIAISTPSQPNAVFFQGHFLERRPPAESASAKVHSCLKLDDIPSCCLRYVRCCYQVKRISLTDYDSLRRCEVAKAWNDFQATLNTRRTFDSIDTTTCPQGWRASQNGVPIVGMQANRSQSLQWFQLQYLTVKFSKFIFVAFVLDFDIFFLDFSSWLFLLDLKPIAWMFDDFPGVPAISLPRSCRTFLQKTS